MKVDLSESARRRIIELVATDKCSCAKRCKNCGDKPSLEHEMRCVPGQVPRYKGERWKTVKCVKCQILEALGNKP